MRGGASTPTEEGTLNPEREQSGVGILAAQARAWVWKAPQPLYGSGPHTSARQLREAATPHPKTLKPPKPPSRKTWTTPKAAQSVVPAPLKKNSLTFFLEWGDQGERVGGGSIEKEETAKQSPPQFRTRQTQFGWAVSFGRVVSWTGCATLFLHPRRMEVSNRGPPNDLALRIWCLELALGVMSTWRGCRVASLGTISETWRTLLWSTLVMKSMWLSGGQPYCLAESLSARKSRICMEKRWRPPPPFTQHTLSSRSLDLSSRGLPVDATCTNNRP